MAEEGIRLGGAWYDVSLRFAEFEKGLKEAEAKVRKSAKRVEESFMVKYTKGFVEKESTRAAENAVKNAERAAKEAEARLETTKKRIAEEIRAEEELERIESERLRIILGINEEMDQQVRKAMALTAAEKQANQMMAGIRAVPIPGTLAAFGRGGGKGAGGTSAESQRAMNMAQLSYAIQDFATGMAMGNFNMAVMGASNNLGMMAQSLSPLAAGLTVIAAALLPHATSAIADLEGSAKRSALGIQFLKDEYQKFQDTLARTTHKIEESFKIQEMTAPEQAITHIKEMNNQEAISNKLADERFAKRKQLGKELKESKIRVGGGMGTAAGVLDYLAFDLFGAKRQRGVKKEMTQEQADVIKQQIKDIDNEDEKAERNKLDRRQQRIEAEEKLLKLQGEAATKMRSDLRIAIGSPLEAANERAFVELQNRLKDIEKHAPPEQREALSERAREAYRQQRKQNEENDKSAKRRLDLEMKPFSTPAQHARLRAQEEYERNVSQIRKLYKNDPQEMAKQEAAAQNKLNEDMKKIDQDEAKSKRRLQGQLISDIDKEAGQKFAIAEKLRERIDEINKMGGLSDAEKKQMIQMATRGAQNELANVGPRGRFVGIGDLNRDIQMNAAGNTYAQSTANNTKGILDMQQPLLTAIQNINMGVGP